MYQNGAPRLRFPDEARRIARIAQQSRRMVNERNANHLVAALSDAGRSRYDYFSNRNRRPVAVKRMRSSGRF